MNAKTVIAIAAGLLILSSSALASSSLFSSLNMSDGSGSGDGSLIPSQDPTSGTLLDDPSSLSDELGSIFGMNLTASQIAQFASAAGFTQPDLSTAVAIALAESGGNPDAVGDKTLAPTNGPSIGLWQINTGSHAHPELAGVDLTDPGTNASEAFAVYLAAGGFHPWSTFNSGAYRAHLDAVNAEIGDTFV